MTLDLVPSRLLAIASGASHLLALAAVAVCRLPLAVSLPLALAVAASFLLIHARHCSARSRCFVDRLCWLPDGRWTLRTRDGVERPARLVGGCVLPRVLILNFALGPLARRSVVVLPDAADPAEARRLRVRLLTRSPLADDPADPFPDDGRGRG